MKKLMTVMASAATALFAIGAVNGDDQPLNATSFESLTLNTQLNTLAGDDGQTTADKYYWYMASNDADNGTLVTNDVAGSGVSRPDCFAQTTNEKALSLDTSSPLFRHMGSTSSGSLPSSGEAIGTGIYLDTLVKFTAADDVFGEDALQQGVDKIAISYVEREEETADGVVTVPALTNFVIRAGYIGANELTVKNYEAKLDGNVEFDKGAWHRLTVRTVPGIDAAGHVGFVVYVDETALVYANAQETIGDNVTLVGVAATVDKSVFPSAVDIDGDNATAITAASFSGTGAIDDVVFTKHMPNFLKKTSEIPVTFTIPTGVSSVTVTYGDEPSVEVAVTPQNPTVNLPAGTEDFTLEVVADTENGYTYAGISGADIQNKVVTVSGASMAITINVARNNFNLFNAQGQAISGTFETLSAALAETGVAKIQLAYDYDVVANETVSDSTPVYVISNDIVLDLNGKTLNGGSSNTRFLFSTGTDCSLTVIDSVSGDDGKIIYGGTYGIFGGQGDIYIGSTELTDYGVVVVGSLCGEELGYVSEVVRGKFLASGNTTNGKFVYIKDEDDLLNLKSTAELVEDYWVVTYDGEQPQPTTYALTIPDVKIAEVTAATATVTAGEETISDFSAIPAGTVVTVTWTAAEGYKITAGATETITMSENKTATAPTVQAIVYATLTITPVANCTIVVSNTTEEVASGATFDKSLAVQLTVYRTPAEGFKLKDCEATEVITMDENRTVTASVEQDGEKTYPAYIDETEKTKYDSWAAYAEISATDFPDAQGTNEEAYLLNCKLNEITAAKAAFKFTGISYDATEEKWVTTTTTGYNGREYNGTVTVKQYSDVGCKTESETGTFFRAVLQ